MGTIELIPSIAATFVPAGFSPLTISGLDFWFNSTAITGKVDTDPISQWDDLSGNGKHLTQATGADQPLFRTAIQNSLPVVRFDGSSDFLRNSALTARSAGTMFVVLSKRSAPASQQGAFDRSSGNARLRTSAGFSATDYVWSNNQATGDTGTTIAAQGWKVIVVRWTSASSLTVRANGGAAAVTLDPDDAITSGTRMTIGWAGAFGDWDFGEVFSYDSALSTSDMDLAGGYLAPKWGTTAWTPTS